MKLGCCLNMLGSGADIIGRNAMGFLTEAGYDYMELPLAQVMELSDGEFEGLLTQIRESGIPCEACNNFFPASVRITGEEADRNQIRAYVERALERAERMGAKVIVFGSSGAKNVPDGFSYEKAYEQIVETLVFVDACIADREIRIAIEPLNRKESNIILNLTDGMKLVEDVKARAGKSETVIRFLVDYYHHKMENESINTVKKAADVLIHAHFAEPDGRVYPEEPCKEYEEFFSVLKAGGYDGRVSVEAYTETPEQSIRKAIFLKEYF